MSFYLDNLTPIQSRYWTLIWRFIFKYEPENDIFSKMTTTSETRFSEKKKENRREIYSIENLK